MLNVPALGYKVVWVGGKGAAENRRRRRVTAKDSGNAITLENATLRVASTSRPAASPACSTRRSNFETLASGACGNQLQFFKDTPEGL